LLQECEEYLEKKNTKKQKNVKIPTRSLVWDVARDGFDEKDIIVMECI